MDIETQRFTVLEKSKKTKAELLEAAKESPTLWHIYRYRVLPKNFDDFMNCYSDIVFFPCHKKHSVRNSKVMAKLQPCIPGYIFIHASWQIALEIGEEYGLHLWQRRAELHMRGMVDTVFYSNKEREEVLSKQFYSISHAWMSKFILTIPFIENDVEILDATDLDLEQDDEVEFLSGPMKGNRGRIRYEEHKAGGLVIVPMSIGDGNGEGQDRRATRHNLLCFGIKARPEEYRVVRFVLPERNRDSIKRANSRAKELLEAYSKGVVLNEKERKQMRGYMLRYAETEMTSDIQRANQSLLLYRIYVMLEGVMQISEMRSRIEERVLTSFDKRIDEARGWHKEHIARQKADFMQELQAIDEARRLHFEALQANCPA